MRVKLIHIILLLLNQWSIKSAFTICKLNLWMLKRVEVHLIRISLGIASVLWLCICIEYIMLLSDFFSNAKPRPGPALHSIWLFHLTFCVRFSSGPTHGGCESCRQAFCNQPCARAYGEKWAHKMCECQSDWAEEGADGRACGVATRALRKRRM